MSQNEIATFVPVTEKTPEKPEAIENNNVAEVGLATKEVLLLI